MNVVELKVMLHHFYDPLPVEPRTDAVIDAERRLIASGLIKPSNPGKEDFAYRATERGRVFVNALVNVPLPVQAWVNPIEEKN